MVIQYFGEGTFRVQNGDFSILVDPLTGHLKSPVVLRTLAPVSSGDHSTGEIRFPGEYEVNGIEITGIAVPSETSEKTIKTIYRVLWDDIRLVFLGHIARPLGPEAIDELGEPDVLFVPVGGGNVLEPDAAAKIAKQLEPAFVIPGVFKSPAEFLKAMGAKASPEEKIVFKKKDLLEEKGRVVVLKSGS